MESTVSGVEVTKLINYSGLYLLDSFEVNIQLASIKAIGLTFVLHSCSIVSSIVSSIIIAQYNSCVITDWLTKHGDIKHSKARKERNWKQDSSDSV